MRAPLYAFCRAVWALNQIPRYGRVYRLRPRVRDMTHPQWRFQRCGWWGVNLLMKMDLLDRFCDEYMWRKGGDH